jgi:hypothetical protein
MWDLDKFSVVLFQLVGIFFKKWVLKSEEVDFCLTKEFKDFILNAVSKARTRSGLIPTPLFNKNGYDCVLYIDNDQPELVIIAKDTKDKECLKDFYEILKTGKASKTSCFDRFGEGLKEINSYFENSKLRIVFPKVET